jgi:type I restriction enzyme S subunit
MASEFELGVDADAPHGWSRRRLGDIAGISGGTTPSRIEDRYWGGSTPWATPTDLTSRPIGVIGIESTTEAISDLALAETSVRVLPAGSVLMTSRATIGEVAVNTVPMATNQGFCNFLPRSGTDAIFLAYWLAGNKKQFERLAGGSTFLELAKRDACEVRIDLPPLPEQQKIAAILSSLDDAIAATRRVIEQTKRVKDGVLQTLMTRGIGHTRFKKTEIGEIPDAWNVVALRDIGQWTSGSTPSKSVTEYWGGNVPWVTPKDMKSPRIYSSQETITDRAVSAGARVVPAGSLLVVVRGMILAHTFPVATTEVAVTINQDMKALVPADQINASFVLSWLQLSEQNLLARVSEATHGTKRLTQSDLLEFPMPFPPRMEQDAIVAALTAPVNAGEVERRRVQHLERLKRGLMQDLLTGRVRVHST